MSCISLSRGPLRIHAPLRMRKAESCDASVVDQELVAVPIEA